MNEKALDTVPDTPLAQPVDPEALAAFDELDPSDYEIPTLHLFQDIGNEATTYGQHPRGAWVHSLTRADVSGQEVLPIAPTKEIIAWWARDNSRGEQGIAYKFKSGSEIPAVIKDNRDFQLIDYINWVLLFDDEPVIVRFKSTGLRAAKLLNTAEKSRATRGQPAGVYQLQAEDRTNQLGKWKHPVFALVRDATAEEMVAVRNYRRIFKSLVARASEAPIGRTSLPPPSVNLRPTEQAAEEAVRAQHQEIDEKDIPF